MLTNYFKIALRNLWLNRVYSSINIFGLAVGIAAILLIGQYIQNQLHYDTFHTNGQEIYRLGFQTWNDNKLVGTSPENTAPIGPAIRNEFAMVKNTVRISIKRTSYLNAGTNTLKVDQLHHADSSFFNVFSFPLIEGNPRTALAEPYTIVLTEETAMKLFGTVDVLNKIVRADSKHDYRITGVAANPPQNTLLPFNGLISFATLYSDPSYYMDWNGGQQYVTYVQLLPSADPNELQKQLPAFMWKHVNQDAAMYHYREDASLQPLTKLHLYFNPYSENLRTNLYVFACIAFLILGIATINYVNLSTSMASRRYKEVGVRKVLGAQKHNLIKQFLGESLLITLVSIIVALILVWLIRPVYAQLMGQPLSISDIFTSYSPFLFLVFLLVLGIGAGSYPAFYLSAFNPIIVLKGKFIGISRQALRSVLVGFQFVITIALLICTFVINWQLNYLKSKPVGFAKDQMLIVPLVDAKSQDNVTVLKQEILKIPTVRQISAVSEVPHDGITSNGFLPEGAKVPVIIHQLDTDADFLKAYSIPLASGRYFTDNDKSNGIIINETLAKTLGWSNPIGKKLNRDGAHEILGVVKDFHFASLHDKVEPLVITNHPYEDRFSYLSIQYTGNNPSKLVESIRNTWKAYQANTPFDYWFLDDSYQHLYQDEDRFQQVFFYFSLLSIILSVLGIFSLVRLAAVQRTKEIGIRKVLGATTSQVVFLLAKDFLILVVIALVIATPIAQYFMNQWLNDFAYRIGITYSIPLAAGLITLSITLIVISSQALKAANANPVKSLRSE